MKPSAVLLIDLENFYLSRIDYFDDANTRGEDRPSFGADLNNLVRYAQRMAGLPLAVRRAYADFDSLNVNPQELMRQGIEPVQVFRLSGRTANKNAADMKLAMDAVALLSSGGQFEHFILVSGDADFIPVILELKRRGHTVSVIAVTGATNELIKRFVDKFELFENLVAAGSAERKARPTAADELPKVAAAIRRILGRARPIHFNVVQSQLTKELGYSFDPDAFGCDSTGEFLRKNNTALGIVLRGTQSEPHIDLPGVPVPSSNGSGSKAVARQAPRATQTERTPAPVPFEVHSPGHYKHLLASGRTDANEARVLVVPWASLVWVCDAVVPALTPPTGGPATSMELMPKLQVAARATDRADLAGHVALIHSAVRCALPVPSVPGGEHVLPAETTGDQIRRRLLDYVLYVLGCRLTENGVKGPIRPEAVAAMFEPGPALEQATNEVAAALAEAQTEPSAPVPVSKSTPHAIPKPSPRTDEIHTAAGYRKLLQCGGPKGSGDTEHMRVNPPPWPSIERVCTDTFAVLSQTNGTGTLQRGQFLERLYAAEKDVLVENYRSHVRRSFTLLGLSHAILEEDERVALHPDVADPGDIRWAVLGILLKLIAVRLDEKGVTGPIRAEVFVEAIEAGPYTDALVPQIARAVEGMYLSAEEVEAEPIPELTLEAPEHAPAPKAELQLEILADYERAPEQEVEPAPFIELLPVGETMDSEAELAVDAEPVEQPEPEPAGEEPSDWDQYSFDGSLPGDAPTTPAIPEQAPEPLSSPVEASEVDVAALTSAAVAAVVEPAVRVIPATERSAPAASPSRSESDLVVFATPIEVAPHAQPEPTPVEDELQVEIPVADWLSDDDSIVAETEVAAEPIAERPTGSSARLVSPLQTQPVHPEESFAPDADFAERITQRLTGSSARLGAKALPHETLVPIARMTPPPLPPAALQPPPLPPLPPESA